MSRRNKRDMKNKITTALCVVAYFALLFGTPSCKKEPLPKTDFFGEWITVTTGFKFEYSIRPDGKFCKKLPEFFNDEEFCCSYRQIGDTLFMFYPTREKWLYRFEEPNTDIMYVNNLLQNGSQPEYFILRRK